MVVILNSSTYLTRCRRVFDDGFKHSLIVYEDRATRALRLHAAVWDGELRQCPVWTAFGLFRPKCPSALLTLFSLPATVTHQSASPTWLKRVSRHRVRLADVQLYVFCRQYRQQNQRRGAIGAFEINFVSEEGTDCGTLSSTSRLTRNSADGNRSCPPFRGSILPTPGRPGGGVGQCMNSAVRFILANFGLRISGQNMV